MFCQNEVSISYLVMLSLSCISLFLEPSFMFCIYISTEYYFYYRFCKDIIYYRLDYKLRAVYITYLQQRNNCLANISFKRNREVTV